MLGPPRQLITDGSAYQIERLLAQRQSIEQIIEAFRFPLQYGTHARNSFETLAEREHLMRGGHARSRARRQAFEVVNRFKCRAEFGARFPVPLKPGDVLLPPRDLRDIQQRLAQPASQGATAHRRARPVKR